MFQFKRITIKKLLEISSIILLILIFIFIYKSYVNFSNTSVSYTTLNNSVRFQIDTLNSLSKTLPQIIVDKKDSYIHSQMQSLYKIQKINENKEKVNVVQSFNIDNNETYSLNITMLPSTHTCMFIKRNKELIGKISIKGLDREQPNCSKDIIVVRYVI